MDAAGTILHNGNVLIRDGKIVATWIGAVPPKGTLLGNAVQIDLGSKGVIFPGLINLHDHPTFDMLELWPAPSSHMQENLGRPLGTEPYANRYQWNGMMASSVQPPEFRRLVDTPSSLLNSPIGSEGRVHFAGDHTSPWIRWMQGALFSGMRAAREINEGPN
jgi:hypothetical protein